MNKFHLRKLLHLINISLVNLVSVSLHLSSVKTFPAVLNSRSTAADEGGIDKTCFASVAQAACIFRCCLSKNQED